MSYKPHNPMIGRYVDVLKELVLAERDLVANRRGMRGDAMDSLVQRIRWFAMDARWFINVLANLESRYPHIKRAMLPSRTEYLEKLEELEEEEEVEVKLVPIKQHVGGKKKGRKK